MDFKRDKNCPKPLSAFEEILPSGAKKSSLLIHYSHTNHPIYKHNDVRSFLFSAKWF